MIPQPPPGQGPIDPRGAFSPPPAQAPGPFPPTSTPQAGPGFPARPGPQTPPGFQSGPGFPGAPGYMPPGPMMPGGPYGFAPPPFFPTPPPKRGGGFKTFVMVLSLLLLGGSLLLNLALFAASVGGGVGGAIQVPIQEGDSSHKIAVIPLNGLLDGGAAFHFDRFMKMVEQDENVKAVVLEIDSPGGTISGSDEIFHRVQRFKQNKPGIPVVVSMGSLAASGGYYAACGADHIFAQPTTMTGSIGVIMPSYNYHKLLDKWGVQENTIVSSGATYKNAGSPMQPDNAEHRQYYQQLIDHAFGQFKTVVTTGRQGKLKANLEDVANGKVFVAAQAKEMGLIDDIGYLEDAWKYAAGKAGLSNPTVVRYHNPPTLLQQLMSARSGIGSPGVSAQPAGGVTVNVNLDPKLLDALSTPRPLYLWRGQ